MSNFLRLLDRAQPTLALQIWSLVLGVVLVTQALFVTVLLAHAPPRTANYDDVSSALFRTEFQSSTSSPFQPTAQTAWPQSISSTPFFLTAGQRPFLSALPAGFAAWQKNITGSSQNLPVMGNSQAPHAAISNTPASIFQPQSSAHDIFGWAYQPLTHVSRATTLTPVNQPSATQPARDLFPAGILRNLLIWFAIAFALTTPIGWLFAQRLTRPLIEIARAAEQLSRNLHIPLMELRGPAEVKRAATALNRMQDRVRNLVEDQTSTVGAISHDLREPLTRMRFRLEDAPDHVREGMLLEVQQMESMIDAILRFDQDTSVPAIRDSVDLQSIVAEVVHNAQQSGGDASVLHAEPANVEVDALSLRRLLSNLVGNAIKYGERAEISVFADQDDVITEVRDNGPGLPDNELERVFRPFYRGANVAGSAQQGSGLGLAVCRSIARAHGGDVILKHGTKGLVAQLRLPLRLAPSESADHASNVAIAVSPAIALAS